MPLGGAHDETIAGDEFGDVVGVFGPAGLSTSGLLVYARDTTERGGSALYTIKWPGLEPNEEGWSPPFDTM